jgi:hypothetical protein
MSDLMSELEYRAVWELIAKTKTAARWQKQEALLGKVPAAYE